ncbi:hypothetical protein DID75_00875 [Candidatus Marinamargulisbacteria bacterium SCGC AG-410-N11]|nr:hypothetical protein DID75_00875 [Candidatus Marinamargulisbacteria bacterium SCGC AG-410-N11]
MKQVFVAATRQNDGKTMVSLGLFQALKNRFSSISYMKPVGQQYKEINNDKIDKDVILFQQVYDLSESLVDMSPIAIPKGFTQEYIESGSKSVLQKKILRAHSKLTKNKDFLLVEGTGHAGVGSVFDLSNADVAKLIGSKVILVSLGGIGRAIDEIMLNKALFDLNGVELLGVVINKTKQEKYNKVSPIIRQSLESKGIPVFGVIPFVDMLIKPTVSSLFESLSGKVLSGDIGYNNPVERCMIGDMVPHDVLDQLMVNTVLIVPSNREGLIMTALCGRLLDLNFKNNVSAIIFTGGKIPHDSVFSLITKISVPLLVVKEDSFTIATKITNMLVKLQANESEKINKIQNLIENHVDIDTICEKLV